ncbi:MAG: maltose phosphorylase [Paraglaciecola sp.]|jgi:maltose phosphorylase
MKDYIIKHPWKIIEEGFDPILNEVSESLCSIGNGRFGQRANFEEKYTGTSLQGSYVAGVYYPDKTRVGWWKNGYPDYFAKVLNATNWIGIDVNFDGEVLDLAACTVSNFRRELNMKAGYLERTFTARLVNGIEVEITAKRFCSIADDEIGAIEYRLKVLSYGGKLTLRPYLDGNVENKDSNYDEKFWDPILVETSFRQAYVAVETKKTDFDASTFQVCTGMRFSIFKNGKEIEEDAFGYKKAKYAGCGVEFNVTEGDEVVLYKYASIVSDLNYDRTDLLASCKKAVTRAFETGFDTLLKNQADAWAAKWEEADIVIDGDISAQQGIRFNIFHLYQTYTGEDKRLNIGPKGFTGEKYGGSTYWDTEAYCLPFYLSTANQRVARQLLVYRHNHLQKAIENAAKLGFKNGAALYPMVTITGEECHNEWEITFEEIHRNGAIAYAIYDYVNYTGDEDYLSEYGAEVLIGIARFWAQRVHFSSRKGQYVMHGVTGPNEYDNNMNNNWYTNYIAKWCLEYTMKAIDFVQTNAPEQWAALKEKVKFYPATETNQWKDIASKMYLPHDKELDVFAQSDGFFDKDWEKTVADLKPEETPINQNWSWDRILRSVYIKQADVLQGIYFFEDDFSEAEIRRNFKFYEPRTVHESSLSPCVHSILAAKLGMEDKAYEMYARSARLDLDDYNNDTEDGLHITSMAGTWLAVIKGFAGMRVKDGQLHFTPMLPENWTSFAFKIRWRDYLLEVKITTDGVNFTEADGKDAPVVINEQ